MTALSTGLGALPMVWYKNVSDWWLGVGNAIAAGMMTAASVALLSEGLDLPGSPRYGVACGVLTGVVFILGSQRIMERNDPNGDVKLAVLDVVDTRKARPPPARPTPGPAPACPALRAPGPTALRPPRASQALLLVLVMTLHSFSEGIGIGVSFGGQAGCPPLPHLERPSLRALPIRTRTRTRTLTLDRLSPEAAHPWAGRPGTMPSLSLTRTLTRTLSLDQAGAHLGIMISTTLAIHNVPEGFAVAVVLVSRGMSVRCAIMSNE